MKYYAAEEKIVSDGGRTAWTKAREDTERIAAAQGYTGIPIIPAEGDRVNGGLREKLRGHITMGRIWRDALTVLKRGDTLFIQLPAAHNSLLFASVLRRVHRRGVRIVALVHDLDTVRMGLVEDLSLRIKARMFLEESGVLRICDRLIVHNDRMAELMEKKGVAREKMISLGIFDYLVEPAAAAAASERKPSSLRDRLIVAGNLHPEKAGYLYDLSGGASMELYGMFYDEERGKCAGHRYHGSFDPGQLPAVLNGGFGLVWDGPAADSCRGPFGEYLRYNNPHKTSLYLASGLPVAIWNEAAMAPFIEKEGVGFAASSVAEAAARAAAMSEEEYLICFRKAAALGERLRRGDSLSAALSAAQA